MPTREVVTKGGGANLYKVSESDGAHKVSQVHVGLLGDTETDLGTSASANDALDRIEKHSGNEIKSVKDKD